MAVGTVLLVDDSRVSRMMCRSVILRHHPDWQVLEASSGEEAIALCQGVSIDFMLIDVNMPGMDGVTTATRLKASHPGARITLLTANIQDTIREKARATGVEFIGKPITDEKIEGFLSQGVPGC